MTELFQNVQIVAAHADWSVNHRKRWITTARQTNGRWLIEAPEPVGEAGTLLARLCATAAGAPVAFGGDFPLGLPRAYAARAGIRNFAHWLHSRTGEEKFFAVCHNLNDVALERPFYPYWRTQGSKPMAALAGKLRLKPEQLRRRVDFPVRTTDESSIIHRRPAGAPLFWTLGANQCGKGALDAWKTCLLPAFAATVNVRLWPYDGTFHELLRPGGVVVAETYPAEAMFQLRLKLNGSKRAQTNRRELAADILERIRNLNAIPSTTLAATINDGFGAHPDGEDRMDSLFGLLCVIRVANGAGDGVPDDPAIRTVEGWVLGQDERTIVQPRA